MRTGGRRWAFDLRQRGGGDGNWRELDSFVPRGRQNDRRQRFPSRGDGRVEDDRLIGRRRCMRRRRRWRRNGGGRRSSGRRRRSWWSRCWNGSSGRYFDGRFVRLLFRDSGNFFPRARWSRCRRGSFLRRFCGSFGAWFGGLGDRQVFLRRIAGASLLFGRFRFLFRLADDVADAERLFTFRTAHILAGKMILGGELRLAVRASGNKTHRRL